MVCPCVPCCSLEKEYSLHEHTMWYGRQPFMTWMWSPAGSTQLSAAKTEIFGGHFLLRLLLEFSFDLFILRGRDVHVPSECVVVRRLFSGVVVPFFPCHGSWRANLICQVSSKCLYPLNHFAGLRFSDGLHAAQSPHLPFCPGF